MPQTFTDPEVLAEAIVAAVGRKIVLGLPLGLGKANHVANALFGRAMRDASIDLHIFTALTLEAPAPKSELERRFMAPISERLLGGYPPLDYAAALHRGDLPPNIRVDEFFFLAGALAEQRPGAAQLHLGQLYPCRGLSAGARRQRRRPARRAKGRALQPELQSRSHARPARCAQGRTRRFPAGGAGQFRTSFHARRRRSSRRDVQPHPRRQRLCAVRRAEAADLDGGICQRDPHRAADRRWRLAPDRHR
ncbi:MAG: hypothetical protein WDM81_06865 [Rhizomicrobium sp.]